MYRIIGFSSEATAHPAANLLNRDTFRHWAADQSAKTAHIILCLNEPTQLQEIKIGNVGCAFIEILVATTEDHKQEDYTVLLPITAVMSFAESKEGKNRTRTVEYNKSKFSAKVREKKKWQILKLVCKQPFTDQYDMGLSFVEINGVSQGGDNDAGHSALNNAAKPEQSPDTSIPTIDSTTKNQSLTKSLTPNTTATATEKKTKPKPKEADKKIFDGVIAVVSGIGKERADIRNKLQSLGGEYRPDWTDDATHLICASAGTPKFTQAKDSSAYIVHPEWVYDSFSNQKKNG